MEASLKNTFAKVRAIVDERISLRDARRKTDRSLSMKRESGESTVPGLFTSDGKEFSEPCCSICMDKVQKSIRMPAPKLCFRIGRLPEGLPVPPVGPRLPNLNAANLSFAARLIIAIRDKFGGDAPRVYTASTSWAPSSPRCPKQTVPTR